MYMYMCKWMGFAKYHLGFYSTHIRPVARIVYRKGWFNKQTDRMRLGVGIRLSETAFRVFLRQYDGMIREYVAKSELWIFRKIFELQNWYFCYSLLYVCILKSAPPEPEWGARGGGGGVGWASSLVTPPLPTFLASTMEIELELHWWEASARSQLLHPCFFQTVKLLAL